jgi:predicted nucleotidyltransferase
MTKRILSIEDNNLKIFTYELKKYFSSRLKKIILFGSRARGEHSQESDYDFMLILDKVTKKDKEFVDKLESKMLLSHFVLFSTFLFDENELISRRYEPFVMNIKREGIILG